LYHQLQDRETFHLLHTQELIKVQYDAKHRFVEFAMGDWVWLRLHQRLAAAITDKSAWKVPRFYGPFRVLHRVDSLAYRLSLPPCSRIHNVFQVVFIKPFVGEPPVDVIQLPNNKHGRVLPMSSSIIKSRLNRGRWEVLMRWMGQGPGVVT
jgi:hypothetical protein